MGIGLKDKAAFIEYFKCDKSVVDVEFRQL